jgi:hypothetical protein
MLYVLNTFKDDDFLKSLSDYLLNTIETSAATGASLVIQKDASLSGAQQIIGKDIGEDWFVCDGDGIKVSFNVLSKEVLDYLKNKALKISGVEQQEILDSIKQQLENAIKEGKSFGELKAGIDAMFDAAGITKLSPFHVQLVFRMNTFAAYSVGQAKQVSEMLDKFPLAYLSAIHDGRARPEHLANEGFYDSSTVPLPPYDYNCRCGVRYVHISQITGNEQVFALPPYPAAIVFDQRFA